MPAQKTKRKIRIIKGPSQGECEVYEYIKRIAPSVNIDQSNRKILYDERTKHYKEIDILMTDVKLGIEYDGSYWHKLKEIKDPGCHARKHELCVRNGITLVHVDDTTWRRDKNNQKQKLLDMYRELKAQQNSELEGDFDLSFL